jgi:spermidine/putrescine-binding protein
MAGWVAFAFLVGALATVAAGCGGSGDSGGKASTEITGLGSTIDEIKSKAKDEGQVDLVIWAGYADKSWAKDFTTQTAFRLPATRASG